MRRAMNSVGQPARVLVVSVVSPAQRLQLGGAEKVLSDALTILSAVGAEVTVLCPENFYFEQTDASEVLPCLRTYGYVWGLLEPASPHLRLLDLQEIGRHAKNADVVLSIDRPFPLHVNAPVALMLLTGAYWEVLRALFMPTYDRVIIPSGYLASITQALAGQQYWTGAAPAHHVVAPYVDIEQYVRRSPGDLASRLGLDQRRPYLLCPHRSEPDKGFDMAVHVLGELARVGADHQLLVPLRKRMNREIDFQRDLLTRARSCGVEDRLIFHDWLPAEDVPAYLSLGAWTLRLGSLPEAFGLTSLQSVSCGTPVLCTPAGALREILPDGHGLRRIWHGDIQAAVEVILNDRPPRYELERGRKYIQQHYSRSNFENRFLDALLTTPKEERQFDPSLPFAERPAPWCTAFGHRVWNDYTATQVEVEPEIADIIGAVSHEVPVGGDHILGDHLSAAQLERARRAGLVVGNPESGHPIRDRENRPPCRRLT
jgi:glycosyltransferase involved in cell wall biosynthesis